MSWRGARETHRRADHGGNAARDGDTFFPTVASRPERSGRVILCMAKPRIPKSLFSKGLDDVATRWLKNTAPADERMIGRLVALEGLGAMEALVFAPRVSFKVYGENVVLALLTNALGVGAMEELLRAGDVEFILWRSFPVEWQKAVLQPGLRPLAGLR